MDYDGNILIDSAEEFSATSSDTDSAFGSARCVVKPIHEKEWNVAAKIFAPRSWESANSEILNKCSPSDAESIVSGINNYRFENGRRLTHCQIKMALG